MKNEEDDNLIKAMKERLVRNPLLAAKILPVLAESQLDLMQAIQERRIAEASNVILDLINAVMSPKDFNRLSVPFSSMPSRSASRMPSPGLSFLELSERFVRLGKFTVEVKFALGHAFCWRCPVKVIIDDPMHQNSLSFN